jgi:hypothetical protein
MQLHHLAREMKIEDASLIEAATRAGLSGLKSDSYLKAEVVELLRQIRRQLPIYPGPVPGNLQVLSTGGHVSEGKKVRVNDLARELKINAEEILKTLREWGVKQKASHSSVVNPELAAKLRRLYAKEVASRKLNAAPDPLLEKQFFFAVAQRPGGQYGRRVSLIPLCDGAGKATSVDQFPTRGLVLWVLDEDQLSREWPPGEIVTAKLEPKSWNGKHHYTVVSTSVARAGLDLAEIIETETITSDGPRRLVTQTLLLDHPPAKNLIVLTPDRAWLGFEPHGVAQEGTSYRFSLTTSADLVESVERPLFLSYQEQYGLQVRCQVSVNQHERDDEEAVKQECNYRLLVADLSQHIPHLVPFDLRLPSHALRRFAVHLVDGSRCDELLSLLDRLTLDTSELPEDTSNLIDELRAILKTQRNTVRHLAEQIVDAGVLDEFLTEKIEARIQQTLTVRSAELETQACDLVTREQHLEAEWRRIVDQETEFEERRRKALALLESSAERWTTGRQQLLGDFIAMQPLLPVAVVPGNGVPKSVERPPAQELIFPPILIESPVWGKVTERDCYERFKAHVARKGFAYRDVDCIAFHMAFKCGDFLVLGGISGTGKSSMPELYMEALLGDRQDKKNAHFLKVAVSPAWLEIEDVLGRVNVSGKVFIPPKSGLLRHLIYAQKEWQVHGDLAGPTCIVLDEMNLAHVERYFSDILVSLGRGVRLENPRRPVRIFEPGTVADWCEYQPYAEVDLVETLRFVGTVNYDETTTRLTDRVLDRGPEILIEPDGPMLPHSIDTTPPSGAEITLRHFREWTHSRAIDLKVAALRDAVEKELGRLGMPPITPRRRAAIEGYLSTTNAEICSQMTTLDLVVSQRLLPLVRNHLTRSYAPEIGKLPDWFKEHDLKECERVSLLIARECQDRW